MPAADQPPPGFYAPDPYGAAWLWMGLAGLSLIALWYAWVFWSTREKAVVTTPRLSPDRLDRLRSDYTHQIEVVVGQVVADEITRRQGHQRLSVLVRHFVQEVSGIRAPTMTLTDLHASGSRLTPVSVVVGELYPGEFAPASATTIEGAAEQAKTVVARWI